MTAGLEVKISYNLQARVSWTDDLAKYCGTVNWARVALERNRWRMPGKVTQQWADIRS